MDLLYLKSLHIIFVVTWFAALFYIGRLFIYHVEAEDKDENEKNILQRQYKLMEKRLWYIIGWPSAILASIFAFLMLYKTPEYLSMPWMHVKLLFVFILYVYHGLSHAIFLQLQKDCIRYSSTKLRIWNEIPSVILFAVVFLVTLKSSVNWIYGTLGIIALSILLMIGIKIYKRFRERSAKD